MAFELNLTVFLQQTWSDSDKHFNLNFNFYKPVLTSLVAAAFFWPVICPVAYLCSVFNLTSAWMSRCTSTRGRCSLICFYPLCISSALAVYMWEFSFHTNFDIRAQHYPVHAPMAPQHLGLTCQRT